MENEKKEGIEIWYKRIPLEEFKEIDISNVKLVEEVHVNAIISIFNLKKYKNKYKQLPPIAVRENDNGEYELVSGVRAFIVAKIFSRNVRAYITTLSREEFKEKYSLEI